MSYEFFWYKTTCCFFGLKPPVVYDTFWLLIMGYEILIF